MNSYTGASIDAIPHGPSARPSDALTDFIRWYAPRLDSGDFVRGEETKAHAEATIPFVYTAQGSKLAEVYAVNRRKAGWVLAGYNACKQAITRGPS